MFTGLKKLIERYIFFLSKVIVHQNEKKDMDGNLLGTEITSKRGLTSFISEPKNETTNIEEATEKPET